MRKPITVQPISRSHVLHGRDSICTIQMAAPAKGINGTRGVLNGRLRSGCVLRSMTIEIHTMVKAIRVPIDTSSLRTWRGKSPAINAVTMLAKIVALWGTPCLSFTFENTFGNNPSLEIE